MATKRDDPQLGADALPEDHESRTLLRPDVEALIKLFDASDLSELTVEKGDRRLSLRRASQTPAGLSAEPLIQRPEPQLEFTQVKAHMVGIFYWSKEKKNKPALSVEDVVTRGQIVGFVEAMGIMNEIEAPADGRVVEIAAASGQPVEYGQLVVLLAPS